MISQDCKHKMKWCTWNPSKIIVTQNSIKIVLHVIWMIYTLNSCRSANISLFQQGRYLACAYHFINFSPLFLIFLIFQWCHFNISDENTDKSLIYFLNRYYVLSKIICRVLSFSLKFRNLGTFRNCPWYATVFLF